MRTFGHCRPVRGDNGEVTGAKPSPPRAVTIKPLGSAFGCDSDKRLIVTLDSEDLITMRPERTQRPISIAAKDAYRFALMCMSNLANLERARARKAAKAARLARQRQERAEKKLFERKPL